MKQVQNILVPEILKKKHYTGIDIVDTTWGGFTPTTVTAFTGSPGSGKTSLALSIASSLSNKGIITAFNTTEQSITQIKVIVERLKLEGNFYCSEYKDIDSLLLESIKNNVKFLVVDSLHTIGMLQDDDEVLIGNTKAVRSILEKLITFARKYEAIIFCICHSTKQGQIRGGRGIEHDVDTHGHLDFAKAKKSENLDGAKELFLHKNRYGPSGSSLLVEYDGFNFTRYVKMSSTQKLLSEVDKLLKQN